MKETRELLEEYDALLREDEELVWIINQSWVAFGRTDEEAEKALGANRDRRKELKAVLWP